VYEYAAAALILFMGIVEAAIIPARSRPGTRGPAYEMKRKEKKKVVDK